MKAFSLLVDVPNRAATPGGDHLRRVAGLLDDNATVVVANMVAGDKVANLEMSFQLGDALELAQAALSGDRRALTRPGIARILSTTAAILFRVSLTAGGIQQLGVTDERGSGADDDRDAAEDDEYHGD